MTQKRLESIDIAKGIGIILVVFAHTLVPQLRNENTSVKFIWIFIYNFHMPLFFFLSGTLFEKGLAHYNDKKRFVAKKLKFLMLPYLTFSVFAYVLIAAAMHIGKAAQILTNAGYSAVPLKDAIFQILTYINHTDQHIWFVYSLFLVFLANILMPKIMKSRVTLVILLGLYVSKAFVHYPGILDYTASDLLFFSLARSLYSAKEQMPHLSLRNFAVTAAVFICTNCIYSYFYVTDMPAGFIKAVLYIIRSAASFTGILTVCALASRLEGKKISRSLKTLGLYSYDIYLIHAPFLVSGSMGIALSYSFPPALCCTVVLCVGILLPYLVSKFIVRKIPPLSLIMLGRTFKSDKKDGKPSSIESNTL